MKLAKHADVFSSVGEKIGRLDRVVMDPETKEVTHLVIKEGVFFTSDKLIPIQYVNREAGERITLNKTAVDLDELPSYEESIFVSFDQRDYPEDYDGTIDAVYWYPQYQVSWWTLGGPIWYPKPKFVKAEKVIPEGKVALEEGADVISRDGEKIGNVERVLLEPEENRATHIVVGRGLLRMEYKLVPTLWIKDVVEDKVYLTIRSDFFERLPEHELTP